MGSDSAETLMSLLPPVGWADVATKHDLAALEERLALRLDGRIGTVEGRMGGLEARMDGFDKRMDGFDKRMDGFDKRMAAMQLDLAGIRKEITSMQWRIFAAILVLVPSLVVPLVTLR